MDTLGDRGAQTAGAKALKSITDLETPALLLDRERLDANIARMQARLRGHGVRLRPHVKTTKSIDVLRRIYPHDLGGITVSTLKEAEYFFGHGVRDILYAVGIAPSKLAHAASLIRRGVQLTVILDNAEAARMLQAGASREGVEFGVLIELDVDRHRAGIGPEANLLIKVGQTLHEGRGTKLLGVMTHAGGSYDCPSDDELRTIAERAASVLVSVIGHQPELSAQTRNTVSSRDETDAWQISRTTRWASCCVCCQTMPVRRQRSTRAIWSSSASRRIS